MSRDVHRYAPPGKYAPQPIDPMRTSTPECSKCGRPILFVEMQGTGKRMPCDPTQVYGDGYRTLVVREEVGRKMLGRVVAKAPTSMLGLTPHFGSCPCRPRKVATVDPRPAQGDLFAAAPEA